MLRILHNHQRRQQSMASSSKAMRKKRPPATSGDNQRVKRRRRDGAATQEALLEAVVTSVFKFGLDRTTISTICAETGLARCIVSHHFQGKDNLLQSALQQSSFIYGESWRTAVNDPKLDAVDRIYALVDHDLDFATSHRAMISFWCAYWGDARATGACRTVHDDAFREDVAGLFRAAGLRSKGALEATIVMDAFILGCWLQLHLGKPLDYLERCRITGMQLVKLFLSGARGERT